MSGLAGSGQAAPALGSRRRTLLDIEPFAAELLADPLSIPADSVVAASSQIHSNGVFLNVKKL